MSDNLSGPIPKIRFCNSCQERTEITDEWRCSNCNSPAIYSTELDTCPSCHSGRVTTYHLNEVKHVCACTRNPEEHQAWIAFQAELKRKDEEMRINQVQLMLREAEEREQNQRLTVAAAKCWKMHNYHCEEPNPYEFCKFCPRYKSTSAHQKPSKAFQNAK